MVVDQVRDFLEQGNIANAVNFPDASHGARSAVPRRDRERQRAQHARPDFHGDGARRPQHPQHAEQVEGRHGLHARRRRQRGAASSCSTSSRAIKGVLSVRYLPQRIDRLTARQRAATGEPLAERGERRADSLDVDDRQAQEPAREDRRARRAPREAPLRARARSRSRSGT